MRRRDLCFAVAAAAGAPPVPAARAAARATPEALSRLAERLRRLDEDGLDPAAYAVPPDGRAASDPAGWAAGVQRAASAALSDLLLGRVRLPAGRPDILRDPSAVPVPRWQAELSEAAEPAAVLDRAALLPAGALALKLELARARALVAAGGWRPIPPGGTLEPGATEAERVAALRDRLRAEDPVLAAAPDGGDLYDAPLLEAVRRWQEAQGLEVDGRVGALSLAALNRPARARVEQLRVNLDMRRAAAPVPPGRRIEVNLPDFQLLVLDGARTVLRMNVVVGRPARATPLLSVRMTAVQFNPPWGVPERNAREDLLPKFQRNPAAMRAAGFRLYSYVGGERIEVDPTTVDWPSMTRTNFPFYVRQDSGDSSALGRLKFIMPNGDDIYMHDTPDRGLFFRPDRAFSSGCIRLGQPMEMLAVAMDGMGWDRARMDAAISSRDTRVLPLSRSLPVRLHYTTAVVDGASVRLRPDIYGLDAAYARQLDAGAARAAGQVAAR